MNRKEVEIIHLNAKMSEHEPDVLLERFNHLHEAGQAIADDYLASLPEGSLPPDYFDDAVNYATNLLYTTGAPIFHPDDIARAVKNHMEWATQKETDDWKPSDDDKIATVEQLVQIGSHLSIKDDVAAYSPHVQGRNHEILDGYDQSYNKFGMLISKRQ